MNDISPAALGAFMKGDMDNFTVASTPGGIEAQEAQGQSDLCSASKLPKDCSDECRAALESAGVVFGDAIDELFLNVTLPEGWKLQPTDHSMWSDLLDENGFVRAAVFFKAAFYDKSAHFHTSKRFRVNAYHDMHEDGTRSIVVVDAKSEKPAKDFGRAERGYESSDALESAANKWLNDNYPDHKNSSAYWAD